MPWKAATTMQASPETIKQVAEFDTEEKWFLVSQSLAFQVDCTPAQTFLTEGVMKSYCTSVWIQLLCITADRSCMLMP